MLRGRMGGGAGLGLQPRGQLDGAPDNRLQAPPGWNSPWIAGAEFAAGTYWIFDTGVSLSDIFVADSEWASSHFPNNTYPPFSEADVVSGAGLRSQVASDPESIVSGGPTPIMEPRLAEYLLRDGFTVMVLSSLSMSSVPGASTSFNISAFPRADMAEETVGWYGAMQWQNDGTTGEYIASDLNASVGDFDQVFGGVNNPTAGATGWVTMFTLSPSSLLLGQNAEVTSPPGTPQANSLRDMIAMSVYNVMGPDGGTPGTNTFDIYALYFLSPRTAEEMIAIMQD